MDFIKGKAETLTPGSPKLREDMALTLSKGLRPTWEMNKENKHVFPLPSEALRARVRLIITGRTHILEEYGHSESGFLQTGGGHVGRRIGLVL